MDRDRDREGSACLTPHWMFHPSRQGRALLNPKDPFRLYGCSFSFCIFCYVFGGEVKGRVVLTSVG
jgi:hypothetical protein